MKDLKMAATVYSIVVMFQLCYDAQQRNIFGVTASAAALVWGMFMWQVWGPR